jgi:hypothetical protein
MSPLNHRDSVVSVSTTLQYVNMGVTYVIGRITLSDDIATQDRCYIRGNAKARH